MKSTTLATSDGSSAGHLAPGGGANPMDPLAAPVAASTGVMISLTAGSDVVECRDPLVSADARYLQEILWVRLTAHEPESRVKLRGEVRLNPVLETSST